MNQRNGYNNNYNNNYNNSNYGYEDNTALGFWKRISGVVSIIAAVIMIFFDAASMFIHFRGGEEISSGNIWSLIAAIVLLIVGIISVGIQDSSSYIADIIAGVLFLGVAAGGYYVALMHDTWWTMCIYSIWALICAVFMGISLIIKAVNDEDKSVLAIIIGILMIIASVAFAVFFDVPTLQTDLGLVEEEEVEEGEEAPEEETADDFEA